MIDAKHTPGPWFSDTSRQYSSHARVDGNEKLICSVGNGESPDVAFGEWSANAHLIAAAPDLLEALKGMLDEDLDFLVAIDAANAAITKAEGGVS